MQKVWLAILIQGNDYYVSIILKMITKKIPGFGRDIAGNNDCFFEACINAFLSFLKRLLV